VERIAAGAGRRVHELQPILDARIAYGVWANIVVPPLAVDGPTMTIRKVACEAISLDRMVKQGTLSAEMAAVLRVATQCRLNVVISGASGSGKTTLLNAISEAIDPGERLVTVEDTGELQLRQPHVVPLESRPLNRIGLGEVTQRQLLRNALHMRPDRIIVGEVRGGEAIDLVMAMGSSQDGVFTTLHAGRPREALSRLETLVSTAAPDVSARSYRAQVAHAVDLIVHVERMDDGVRRVTHMTEVVGLEDDTIVTQDLFTFEGTGVDDRGRVLGAFKASGVKPRFMERASRYGLEDTLRGALATGREPWQGI
jgi:pilus assembly protein CpaF